MDNEDFNEFDFNNGFTLNYQKISEQPDLLAVTRLLAHEMMRNPYMVVGDFFKRLSDGDLETLLELIHQDSDDADSEVFLLTEMLCRAEGSESDDLEQVARNISAFKILVAGTSLHRKGMIRAYYDKFSFGKDMETEIVFDKL